MAPTALQGLIPLWQRNDHPDREDKPIVLTDGCPPSRWWKHFVTYIKNNCEIGGWGKSTSTLKFSSVHTAMIPSRIQIHLQPEDASGVTVFAKGISETHWYPEYFRFVCVMAKENHTMKLYMTRVRNQYKIKAKKPSFVLIRFMHFIKEIHKII